MVNVLTEGHHQGENHMMRRRRYIYGFMGGFLLLAFLASGAGAVGSIAPPVFAGQGSTPTDTIHLKNGSILHGLVVRFENGIFTIMIPGTLSRAMIHVNDVDRIEFVEAKTSVGEQQQGMISPAPRRDVRSTTVRAEATPVERARSASAPRPSMRSVTEAPARSAVTSGSEPALVRRTGTASTSPASSRSQRSSSVRAPTESPAVARPSSSPATSDVARDRQSVTQVTQPARTIPVKETVESGRNVSGAPGGEPTEITPPERKPINVPLPRFREVTVNVPARDVWTDSGLDISAGDRIRFAASGRVNLSPSLTSGPEGVNIADPGKMIPNRPTGGLIAVIGDDNDDFIFIGRAAELVAERSGRLFLMVNEDNLDDNSGAFTVRIQVQSPPRP